MIFRKGEVSASVVRFTSWVSDLWWILEENLLLYKSQVQIALIANIFERGFI